MATLQRETVKEKNRNPEAFSAVVQVLPSRKGTPHLGRFISLFTKYECMMKPNEFVSYKKAVARAPPFFGENAASYKI